MAGDDKQKITINGSTTAYNPSFQDNITLALLHNGSIKRIQSVLQQRLDEAGWSQNLRDHVEQLFRSGEVTTYDEAMKLVARQIALQPASEENSGRGAKGGAGHTVPSLAVPRDVARDAADTVKKELAKVVKVEK